MTITFKPIGTYSPKKKRGPAKTEWRIAFDTIKVGQEFFYKPKNYRSFVTAACAVSKQRGIRISVRKSGDGYVSQAFKKEKK